jgi:deoxyribodipyrimidine photolyase-related protein
MSDYCKKCEYNQKESTGDNACPFNTFYWHFLLRNEEKFSQNHRMALIMKGLAAKPESWKKGIFDRANFLRKPDTKI